MIEAFSRKLHGCDKVRIISETDPSMIWNVTSSLISRYGIYGCVLFFSLRIFGGKLMAIINNLIYNHKNKSSSILNYTKMQIIFNEQFLEQLLFIVIIHCSQMCSFRRRTNLQWPRCSTRGRTGRGRKSSSNTLSSKVGSTRRRLFA